jgi:hypothetical protein
MVCMTHPVTMVRRGEKEGRVAVGHGVRRQHQQGKAATSLLIGSSSSSSRKKMLTSREYADCCWQELLSCSRGGSKLLLDRPIAYGRGSKLRAMLEDYNDDPHRIKREIVAYPVRDYVGPEGKYCPAGSPGGTPPHQHNKNQGHFLQWDDGVHYAAPVPLDEDGRLKELHALEVLDSPPDADIDAITEETALLFGVPIALVSLVDKDRQWFKSNVGLTGVASTPRHASMCAHIMMRDAPAVMVVPDALQDRRFRFNPLVSGFPFIRFYAGCALILSTGNRIGTLCLIDEVPRRRTWSAQDDRLLKRQAQKIMALLEACPQARGRRRSRCVSTSLSSPHEIHVVKCSIVSGTMQHDGKEEAAGVLRGTVLSEHSYGLRHQLRKLWSLKERNKSGNSS